YLDLLPDLDTAQIIAKLSQPRGKRSLSEHLRRTLGISGIKTALIYETTDKTTLNNPQQLAQTLKALPVTCQRPRPMDEAISTSGGIAFDALDQYLMLKQQPGTFCAGEMLDWDAPTGGYLLTACIASGYVAGQGVVEWMKKNS
ncbi:MAG: NAD(P)/FAD-dependent oxidoreductase, partial [Gammaproteobacteria bacterium]|nr:NAD(P)/FAD-dependent oxidoreductase [Gammaproteobacteria bacterium]